MGGITHLSLPQEVLSMKDEPNVKYIESLESVLVL